LRDHRSVVHVVANLRHKDPGNKHVTLSNAWAPRLQDRVLRSAGHTGIPSKTSPFHNSMLPCESATGCCVHSPRRCSTLPVKHSCGKVGLLHQSVRG
jgi:hypothetical protein